MAAFIPDYEDEEQNSENVLKRVDEGLKDGLVVHILIGNL
jgi:hypothetical protein